MNTYDEWRESLCGLEPPGGYGCDAEKELSSYLSLGMFRGAKYWLYAEEYELTDAEWLVSKAVIGGSAECVSLILSDARVKACRFVNFDWIVYAACLTGRVGFVGLVLSGAVGFAMPWRGTDDSVFEMVCDRGDGAMLELLLLNYRTRPAVGALDDLFADVFDDDSKIGLRGLLVPYLSIKECMFILHYHEDNQREVVYMLSDFRDDFAELIGAKE